MLPGPEYKVSISYSKGAELDNTYPIHILILWFMPAGLQPVLQTVRWRSISLLHSTGCRRFQKPC
jgi:hypothetical protein